MSGSAASPPVGEWSLTVRLESRLENLGPLRETVGAACGWLGATEKERYEIELAVVEAASNAVRHAHADDPRLPVVVTLAPAPGGMEIVIRDQGPGIPEEAWHKASVERQRRAAELAIEGGRGLFLIRELMDEAEYSEREGGNCWRMLRRLGSSAEA